jgi:sugar lactone lactonase YvrE
MPEELRERLNEASSSSGRSLNREIVHRLEGSLEDAHESGGNFMNRNRRTALVLVATAAIAAAALVGITASTTHHASKPAQLNAKLAAKELHYATQGGHSNESAELLAAMQQFDNARTAPGDVVAPGGYSAAYGSLQALSTTGGAWNEITRVPYDADDPDYRDYDSNSSGGAGLVTGRITGLVADDAGYVYAAGADGGVWRSSQGGGNWVAIADSLPSLSSGDLELAPDGSLWYATGEANTGGTSYAGTGVYRLANPRTGAFAPADRVGGAELESTTINSIRFAGGTAWAATLRGVFSHPLADYASTWTARLQPNPSYLPGRANAGVQNAAYMNIANDLVVDPNNAKHLLAALGWRSGAAYNGFYESTDGGSNWARVNPTGGLDGTDVGYANFAYSKDGSELYVINQSPRKINTNGTWQSTYLDGIYESKKGLLGPWNKIASSDKLGATSTGSALSNHDGQGYSPGVQSWYNQFIAVDPANKLHVVAGLEEVYETWDGGSSWKTIGPYWNFGFACWRTDSLYAPNGSVGCPLAPHSDQHSVSIGKVGGTSTLFVGNDGGVYSRPLAGNVNAAGHGTDWKSLNDGTMDALQYYYVGVGKLQADDAQRPDLQTGDQVLVSGGLQDNGGSLLRPGSGKMVSNFGGDGGDVLVDPNDGCNIVQEYVYLDMEITQTCANPGPGHPNAFLDRSDATSFDIAPPDVNAQFIAPFTANDKNVSQWVAAGNSLWYQDKGFAIRSSSTWQKIYTLPSAAQTFTAVSYSGNRLLATWCGPCSNSGAALFKRGAVVGTFDSKARTWSVTPVALGDAFPNRTLQGASINPNDQNDLFIGINGFSRRFTEGPGAGIGHVYESKDGGKTWNDISTNIPDIPVNDVISLADGGLAVATDLGVVYRAAGSATWTRLGSGLPTTTVMDIHVGPDGNLYAGTHGRGIWRVAVPAAATPKKR